MSIYSIRYFVTVPEKTDAGTCQAEVQWHQKMMYRLFHYSPLQILIRNQLTKIQGHLYQI